MIAGGRGKRGAGRSGRATIIGADIDKMSQREQIIDELAKKQKNRDRGPETPYIV